MDFSSKEVYPTEESLSVIDAENGRLQELEGTSVVRAVQFAREGCFLTIYPRLLSFPGTTSTKWVWLDSEQMSLVWETEDGAVQRVYLSDIRTIATGWRSKFFRKRLEPADLTSAFELRTISLRKSLRRHYRMVCHDQRECNFWLVALATTLVKAGKLKHPSSPSYRYSGGPVESDPRYGGEVEDLRRADTLVESQKPNLWGVLGRHHVPATSPSFEDWLKMIWTAELHKELASFTEIMRLLADLGVHADVTYVRALFERQDTDGSAIISLKQFRVILSALIDQRFLVDLLRSTGEFGGTHPPTPPPPNGPLGANRISLKFLKQWLMDNQYEEGARADSLIADLIDFNKAYLSTEDFISFLGFFVLLKINDSLDVNMIREEARNSSLSLSDYWIKASPNPFDTLKGSAHSDLAMCLRRTIDLGYRCFTLYLQRSQSGKPVIKPHEWSTDELLLTSALSVIKACAFEQSALPIIIHLDMRPTVEERKSTHTTLASLLEHELADVLYKHTPGAPLPTLKQLEGKIVLSFCSDFTPDYFQNRSVGMADVRDVVDSWRLPPRRAPPPAEGVLGLPDCLRNLATIVWERNAGSCVIMTGSEFRNRLTESLEAQARSQLSVSRANSGESDVAEESPRSGRRSELLGSKILLNEPLSTPTPLVRCKLLSAARTNALRSQLPLEGQGHLFYFNGCNIVWDSPTKPSNATNALFPSMTSYIPKNRAPRPCSFSFQLLGGHLLPCPLNGMASEEVFKPMVSVKMYGRTGLLLHKRVGGADGLSPKFELQFTIQLEDENTSLIVFEIYQAGEGASVLLGGRAHRVVWLKSGVRWVALKDARHRTIQWSGLWIHSQKKTTDKMMSSRKLLRSTRAELRTPSSRSKMPEKESPQLAS